MPDEGSRQEHPSRQPPDSMQREIDELEFLVGNACSRAINLLMAGDKDRAALREEMTFLGEKASRLAELLGEAAEA